MSSFFEFLFTEAPWLRPVLAWSLGLVLAFLILCIPAYFVFWPFLARMRKAIWEHVGRLTTKLAGLKESRRNALHAEADEFLNDGGLWRLHSSASGKWSELSGRLLDTLKRTQSAISGAIDVLTRLGKSISALKDKLQKQEVMQEVGLPVLPDVRSLAGSEVELRLARMRLIVTSVILLGLMLVNTGMLSEILKDLGVVPPNLTLFGIHLYYFLAFLLTLAEAGIGALHGIYSKPNDNPERLNIWPIFWMGLALIVACVEGFFYSRIAPQGETFTLPFVETAMAQSSLFFLWGFALVMTLFGLGMATYEALDRIGRGNMRVILQGQLEVLKKQHEKYSQAVIGSKQAIDAALVSVKELDGSLAGPTAYGQSVAEQVERLRREIAELQGTTPPWAQDAEERLTRSEVLQLSEKAGMWLLLALVGAAAMVLTAVESFARLYPDTPSTFLWVLAVAEAAMFFSVGAFFSAGETIVQGKGQERPVWTAPKLTRILAYTFGGLVILSYAAFSLLVAVPKDLGLVWYLNFLIGLLLMAAGYQLSPLIHVLRLFFMRTTGVILDLLEALWSGLVKLFGFTVTVLEKIAHFFATPIIKILRREDEPVATPE
jgi:hypothetical protein